MIVPDRIMSPDMVDVWPCGIVLKEATVTEGRSAVTPLRHELARSIR